MEIVNMTTSTNINEEPVLIKMIEQNLKGVMFHSFNSDLFDLLDLKGFMKMHLFQYKEESANLKELKHLYMSSYNKMPKLQLEGVNYWKDCSICKEKPSTEEIPAIVKNALKQYADWETSVLENLFKWKREILDRKKIHNMIEDVMIEINQIETIMDILESHNYSYECICEMSQYLDKKF